VEVEVNQHVMVPWEPHVLLLFKLQPWLFHLLPYMLKKFNWDNSFLDDFKAMVASYRVCPEGWDEWIDKMFMASFGLWTHKDQESCKCLHYCIYEIFGLQCHIVLELCKKNLCNMQLICNPLNLASNFDFIYFPQHCCTN